MAGGERVLFVRSAAALLVGTCWTAGTPAADPQADVEMLLQAACAGCHGLDLVHGAVKSEDEWRATIQDMIARGAQVFPQEVDVLAAHLAADADSTAGPTEGEPRIRRPEMEPSSR